MWPELCSIAVGRGSRWWLAAQTLGWLFVAGVAASSARTWAAKWGEFHTDRTTFLGASKTFGFMAMDLLAAKVLHNVNGSFGVWLLDGLAEKVGCIVNSVQLLLCDAHPGAAPPSDRLEGGRAGAADGRGRAEGLGEEEVAEEVRARLETRARELLLWGLVLAVAQAIYWVLFLWDTRERWKVDPKYFWLTAVSSCLLVMTSPGLICAVYPALQGYTDSHVRFERLVQRVRDAKASTCSWDGFIVEYSIVDSEVAETAGKHSLEMRYWLWSVGLGAVMHGMSMWLWIDKLKDAPRHAVYMTHALAVLHGVIFLRVYFMFTGMSKLHGALLKETRSHLCRIPSDHLGQVAPLVRALEYFTTRAIRWNVELWEGSTVVVDQLRGRFLSLAFVANILAKNFDRVVGLYCRSAQCGSARPAGVVGTQAAVEEAAASGVFVSARPSLFEGFLMGRGPGKDKAPVPSPNAAALARAAEGPLPVPTLPARQRRCCLPDVALMLEVPLVVVLGRSRRLCRRRAQRMPAR